MKFKFEDQTSRQQQSQRLISKTSSKQRAIRPEYSEVKSYLTTAVDMFKNQIDQEIKVQEILKKQIKTINEELAKQSFIQKRFFIKKSQSIKDEQRYLDGILEKKSEQTDIKKPFQGGKDDGQRQKQLIVEGPKIDKNKLKGSKEKPQKLRSIKSELLTKGYPVAHKLQSLNSDQANKSKMPYRFRLNH